MRRIALGLAFAATVFSSQADAFPFWNSHRPAASDDVGDLIYRATDRLIENMRPRPGHGGILSLEDQVIVSTIVSVDDLSRSSTLGRTASQLVLSRLSQRGYQTRDVTYLRALDIAPSGERVLSRGARQLSKSSNASAVVAGTYAVGGQTIWISLRLLSAEDGSLISASDVSIPLNADTWPLVDAQAPRVTHSPAAVLYGTRSSGEGSDQH
jgi:hypothetical protein